MTARPPASFPDGPPVAGAPAPRVLVVDDSAPLRAAIAQTLTEGGCDVVGRAMDGALALRLVMEQNPDVITLDLEMPRMDGFTFLRILAKTKNTPVIVITSDVRPEAALMALELGARDFVVKPERAADIRGMHQQLLARVRTLAALRTHVTPAAWSARTHDVAVPRDIALVAIGCSTGGPGALRDIFGQLRTAAAAPQAHAIAAPIVVAQHMPPRFTAAFATRLQRSTGLDIAEARDGEVLSAGMIRIAAGGGHLDVDRNAAGAFVCRVTTHAGVERWVPSVDRLLSSAVDAAGKQLLGVVLTGMGRDGSEGAKALADAGATLWCESALTATVDGMPANAAASYGAAPRIDLDALAQLLCKTLCAAKSAA